MCCIQQHPYRKDPLATVWVLKGPSVVLSGRTDGAQEGIEAKSARIRMSWAVRGKEKEGRGELKRIQMTKLFNNRTMVACKR